MIILNFVYLVFDTELFIGILLKENIGKLYIAIALYRLGDTTFNSRLLVLQMERLSRWIHSGSIALTVTEPE